MISYKMESILLVLEFIRKDPLHCVAKCVKYHFFGIRSPLLRNIWVRLERLNTPMIVVYGG